MSRNERPDLTPQDRRGWRADGLRRHGVRVDKHRIDARLALWAHICLGAWPTTRLAAPWWEAAPVWMPFLRTEWDGQAF